MAHDEFNSGARHGFSMALYAVRNVDKQINRPERKDFTQKDLLYKIYEQIKKQMEEEVHENDY